MTRRKLYEGRNLYGSRTDARTMARLLAAAVIVGVLLAALVFPWLAWFLR